MVAVRPVGGPGGVDASTSCGKNNKTVINAANIGINSIFLTPTNPRLYGSYFDKKNL